MVKANIEAGDLPDVIKTMTTADMMEYFSNDNNCMIINVGGRQY